MAIKKIKEFILGSGDIVDTSLQSVWKAVSVDPTPSDGANGDIWIRVDGARTNLFQKVNGYWISLTEKPVITTLADNQSNANAIELPAALFRNLEINYVIKRGGNSRIIKGTLNITHDGVLIQYTDEFIELGLDTGVELLDPVLLGGNVRVNYNSTNESINPVIEWYVKGWE